MSLPQRQAAPTGHAAHQWCPQMRRPQAKQRRRHAELAGLTRAAAASTTTAVVGALHCTAAASVAHLSLAAGSAHAQAVEAVGRNSLACMSRFRTAYAPRLLSCNPLIALNPTPAPPHEPVVVYALADEAWLTLGRPTSGRGQRLAGRWRRSGGCWLVRSPDRH